MEKNSLYIIDFNEVDISNLQRFIGKECEISLKKSIHAEVFGSSSITCLKGVIENVGKKTLSMKHIYKKKEYTITFFLDNISNIILL